MDLLKRWTVLKFVRFFAVLAVTGGTSPHFVYREDWKEQSCAKVLNRVRHQPVETPHPPDIVGEWVSYRCEIRSGPEYVIRHFSFKNRTFESFIYRYADPDCHEPLYAIHSRGTHKLSKASWTVKGGTEAEYEVMDSYVIPYSKNTTRDVAQKLAEGCKDIHAYVHMKPYSKYLIYSIPLSHRQQQIYSQDFHQDDKKDTKSTDANRDIDCFKALNFTLNELQLVMLEVKRHPHHNHHHNHLSGHHRIPHEDVKQARKNHGPDDLHLSQFGIQESRELLLGAVHSKPKERQKHRPSSFQTALKDARTPGCGVCSRILSASPEYPPHLTTHTGTLLSLEGEWVSTRCESRQYGMFLTRWLHFLPDGTSWQGQYDYYHDALCRYPSFSLNAKGNYAGGTDSLLVKGAKDYSFKVTRLKVTPHDKATVDSMNHYGGNGCGKAHGWAVGKEQDVTWTGGCVTLGIRLPNMERDIMKMEIVHRKLHLYVGQRLVDRKAGTTHQKERPTAFQEPMVKCDQASLDMSINTAPGGHGWAGGVALPLSAGPEDFNMHDNGSQWSLNIVCLLSSLVVIVMVLMSVS